MSKNTSSNIISKLNDYISMREGESEYKTQFFLCLSVVAGYSKAEKLDAARALIQSINGTHIDLCPFLPVLSNGRLGSLLKEFIKSGDAKTLLASNTSVSSINDFIRGLNQRNNIIPKPSLAEVLASYR